MMIDMRCIMLLLIAFSLAFPVGTGTSNTKTFALEQSYDCEDGKLTITVSEPAGTLAGVDLEMVRYGSSSATATGKSSNDGRYVFTVTEDGAYLVKGSRSGYSGSSLLVSIKSCRSEPAETFHCTDGATLSERVGCIIGLPDSDVLNVRFVPEECRVLDEEGKQGCIATYRLLQTCRIGFAGDDDAREGCIKPKLNLSESIWDDFRSCGGDKQCIGLLRGRVYTLAKFRIYNLEYKVQEMMDAGLGRDKGVGFIAYVEEAKARFNSAATVSAKKEVVREVKERWDEFVIEAKSDMGVAG